MNDEKIKDIKKCIEQDIEFNKKNYGIGYPDQLGLLLHIYLDLFEWYFNKDFPRLDDKMFRMFQYANGLEKILKDRGKEAKFHHIIGCGNIINELVKSDDKKSIGELRKYAEELLSKPYK